MKTDRNPSEPIPTTGFFGGWNRFWYKPNDPLVIGFMRLVAGMMILYVHLAYCFDLQAFMGKNGWWSLEAADRERHEVPWFVAPVGWDEADNWVTGIRLPDILPRREPVMKFLRGLPDRLSEREALLGYLFKLDPKGNNYAQYLEGLAFIEKLALSDEGEGKDEIRAEWLREKWEPKGPIQLKNDVVLPRQFRDLKGPEREEKIQEILAFGRYLPDRTDELRTLITYLGEYQIDQQRAVFFKFIRELPTDAAERAQILDYLEFWGFDPRTPYHMGKPSFSIWFHVTDPTAMWLVHFAILGCILCFAVGLFTRTMGVLTWVGTMSYIHRTQLVLFGMDQMQNILIMYLVIGDAGQALSLDRLWARRRAARAIANAGGKSVPWAERVLAGPESSWTANLAVRLFQIHFCIIYASSGLSKLKGDTWWNTSAAWMSVANPEFSPIQFPFYEMSLRAIAAYQPALALFSTSVVAFTFILEIGFPTLIWTRFRPYFVIGSVLLHTGIAVCMGLTCFALLMMCLVACYFPAAVIRERICWGKVPKLKLQYDAQKAAHRNLLQGLLTFDGARQIEYVNTPGLPHAKLVGPENRVAIGDDIVRTAYDHLPMLGALGWLRLVPGFGGLFAPLRDSEEGGETDVSLPSLPNDKVGAGS